MIPAAFTMLTILSRSVMSARAFAKSPMQMFAFSTTPVVEKLKTHKGAAKRWKAIANGNVSLCWIRKAGSADAKAVSLLCSSNEYVKLL